MYDGAQGGLNWVASFCLCAAGLSASGLAAAPAPANVANMCSLLSQLAARERAEILYDERLCRSRSAEPPPRGLALVPALTRLLAGTGVGFRRTADGAFVLFALPQNPPPDTRSEAVPEILVVGRRTQNADIRRTRNDIQPYKVATRSDIETAHRDNLDQFLRSRVPANADPAAPAQNTYAEPGAVRSQVDFRGLGAQRTLVLVDGRRMPSVPTVQSDYLQPDLNGIPLIAIERIETLTGTAGGIYGPGAVGGVVNLVVRRGYHGLELRITPSITGRGGAAGLRLEGIFGFTPDGGRTHAMLVASRSVSDPLLTGQRDYAARARRAAFSNAPALYASHAYATNSVGVVSTGGDLVFNEANGGGALGASFTLLPLGFAGTPGERNELLAANAGKVDLSLPEDQTGTRRYLLSNASVTSLLMSVRHRFGSNLEAFAGLIYANNRGRLEANPGTFLSPTPGGAAYNPFRQPIAFSFPEPYLVGVDRREIRVRRYTFGLIGRLGHGWAANADYSFGRSVQIARSNVFRASPAFANAVRGGAVGPNGQPILDPLGNWAEFLTTAPGFLFEQKGFVRLADHFSDAGLRLAGPLAPLPGGPLSLTLAAEERREHVPAATSFAETFFGRSSGQIPTRTIGNRSLYAEFRAPLVERESGPRLLRGLEFQLAGRYDASRTFFPVQPSPGFPSNDDLLRIRRHSISFTAGARLFPLPELMLRGSIATGELQPTIAELSTFRSSIGGVDAFGAPDPKRGNRRVATEGSVFVLRGGRPRNLPERARTISVGAVLNPFSNGGPRIGVDFSRIERRRDIVPFVLSVRSIVADEETYPGRVTRAPLTEADRLAGFTGGRITELDLTSRNEGRTTVETLDVDLDWQLMTRGGSTFRLFGSATWEPRFDSRASPSRAAVSRVGYADGPLEWRGNLGIEWVNGATTLDLNAQYLGRYRVTYADPAKASLNANALAFQGGRWIPSQVYLDLAVERKLLRNGRRAGLTLALGIQNIFGHVPPIVAQPSTAGYSLYGDPRGRRFQLTLSSQFR
ncbi:MAG TPA: TonB-dependent receptor [Allosphingosinicella sp.]|jgi:outer membrane receptor protein involved in Fe transport